MFRKILLAFDDSVANQRAGAVAVELAHRFERKLLVVTAIEGLARSGRPRPDRLEFSES